MKGIRYKKPVFPISESLRKYLVKAHRETSSRISYHDLLRYTSAITFFDKKGNDTLWETLIYSESDRQFIYDCLFKVYAELKVGGDVSVIDHLYVDRVDLCMYANTHPVRVRIVNKLNDLFDYFYIKQADASRIYGMEFEHFLSPNKINFLVCGNTMIEEHIAGIPGGIFAKEYLKKQDYNPLRIAKEFVKFNERCLVQLVGDMRGDNFVVEIVPDFDEVYFRMRAIDFDQHGYEGDLKVYMPQFFKENNPIIELGLRSMTPVLELQYQKEERTRMSNRVKTSAKEIEILINAMHHDEVTTPEKLSQLKTELAELYQDDDFLSCTSTGEIVRTSLNLLFKYPMRPRRMARAFNYS